jgi:hypothetical protein
VAFPRPLEEMTRSPRSYFFPMFAFRDTLKAHWAFAVGFSFRHVDNLMSL